MNFPEDEQEWFTVHTYHGLFYSLPNVRYIYYNLHRINQASKPILFYFKSTYLLYQTA